MEFYQQSYQALLVSQMQTSHWPVSESRTGGGRGTWQRGVGTGTGARGLSHSVIAARGMPRNQVRFRSEQTGPQDSRLTPSSRRSSRGLSSEATRPRPRHGDPELRDKQLSYSGPEPRAAALFRGRLWCLMNPRHLECRFTFSRAERMRHPQLTENGSKDRRRVGCHKRAISDGDSSQTRRLVLCPKVGWSLRCQHGPHQGVLVLWARMSLSLHGPEAGSKPYKANHS